MSQRILIAKNRAMGDAIMGLSAVEYLRFLRPKSKIYYGVPAWVAPLFKDVETAADEIIPLKLTNAQDSLVLWKELSRRKLDWIHELHQSGRGKKFFGLYSFFKRVRYTAHNHHLKVGPIHDQGVIKSLIQRDLDGLYTYFGDGVPPRFLDYPPKMNGQFGPRKMRVILGVVATRETKKWPLDYYVALTRALLEKHSELEIEIPLSKSSDDTKTANYLISQSLPSRAKIVTLPLEQLPKLFKESRLYVGNDTGLKHLAVAVGTKTLTLFGPEPPLEWHPYDPVAHPFIYREGLECRTRLSHYCGLQQCDSMICLNEFSPTFVGSIVSKEIDTWA